MKTKVTVLIKNGIVQRIASNHKNVEVIVIDKDDNMEKLFHISGTHLPDTIIQTADAQIKYFTKPTNG